MKGHVAQLIARYRPWLVVAPIMAAVGVLVLLSASAADNKKSVEAEQANPTGPAVVVADSNASNGQFVEFREQPSGNNNAILEQFRNPDSALQQNFNTPQNQLPYNTLTWPAQGPANPFVDGQFRVGCHYSHMLYDDPIVFPGQPGASHLHVFYGNTGVNGNSTNSSLLNTGGGSCGGYALNRTGYWMPALLDDQGRVRLPDDIVMYYKSKHPELVQKYPAGLKMIAAKDNTQRAGVEGVHWGCTSPQVASGVNDDIIPANCASSGGWLKMGIAFPQCWDGVNLDSVDHKSHMYFQPDNANDQWRCPASHPVMFTQYSLLTYWYVGPGTDMTGWSISSDAQNNTSRGNTAHADWWGGWDDRTQTDWVVNCINASRNCSLGNLGNGRQLIRRYPGQSYPDGVGDGLGYAGCKTIDLVTQTGTNCGRAL